MIELTRAQHEKLAHTLADMGFVVAQNPADTGIPGIDSAHIIEIDGVAFNEAQIAVLALTITRTSQWIRNAIRGGVLRGL